MLATACVEAVEDILGNLRMQNVCCWFKSTFLPRFSIAQGRGKFVGRVCTWKFLKLVSQMHWNLHKYLHKKGGNFKF